MLPLLQSGLIKGGDLDNAIVIYDSPLTQDELDSIADQMGVPRHHVDTYGYVNDFPLHSTNEPARHKLLDVIGDVPAYPEWATGTTAAEVTEAGDRPLRPKRAKFTLETVLKDVYELEYEWADDGVSWSLLSSQLQKSQSGRYVLTEADGGATKVLYELEIVTAVPMLGICGGGDSRVTQAGPRRGASATSAPCPRSGARPCAATCPAWARR